MKADSVIDCSVDKASISNAISNLYSQEFQFKLANVVNPYGEIGASIKILKIIENIQYPINLKKKFYDLKCE